MTDAALPHCRIANLRHAVTTRHLATMLIRPRSGGGGPPTVRGVDAKMQA